MLLFCVLFSFLFFFLYILYDYHHEQFLNVIASDSTASDSTASFPEDLILASFPEDLILASFPEDLILASFCCASRENSLIWKALKEYRTL